MVCLKLFSTLHEDLKVWNFFPSLPFQMAKISNPVANISKDGKLVCINHLPSQECSVLHYVLEVPRAKCFSLWINA